MAASTSARERAKRQDRAHLGRMGEADEVFVEATRGARVVGADGRERLDLLAGWCVANLGWGQEEVQARLRRFRGPDYVPPGMRYAPWGELAALLAEMAPGKLSRVYRATGGTEAVDIALQAAMLATGRRRFVTLEGAYHGNSVATLALASPGKRKALGGLFAGSRQLKPPFDEDALDPLERALRRGDVAALVMEPVPCGVGVHVPTDAFMEGAQRLCRRHGALLVMDEVACGMGRTGKVFASAHYDIEPDLLCLAKGLTGGYAPMGATLMTEALARKVGDELSAYSTYGWHPLAVEAALAVVGHLRRHEARLMRNVEARGAQIERALREMRWRGEVGVRRKGLAIAVETEDDAYASRVVAAALRKDLLLTNDGATLQLFPPLTIDEATVEEGMRVLASVVRGTRASR